MGLRQQTRLREHNKADVAAVTTIILMPANGR